MGNRKDEYSPVGSAEDVAQVNPMTEDFYKQLAGYAQQFQQGMGAYGPQANIAALAGAEPALSRIAQRTIDPYATQAQSTADLLSQRAVQNVASQFAGGGALNTGAALSAMTRGAAEPVSQAATNIAQMRSQLGGGLLGQQLGGMQQAYQTQAGLLGQMLGAQAGFAAPEWWQPTYVPESKNLIQKLFG